MKRARSWLQLSSAKIIPTALWLRSSPVDQGHKCIESLLVEAHDKSIQGEGASREDATGGHVDRVYGHIDGRSLRHGGGLRQGAAVSGGHPGRIEDVLGQFFLVDAQQRGRSLCSSGVAESLRASARGLADSSISQVEDSS